MNGIKRLVFICKPCVDRQLGYHNPISVLSFQKNGLQFGEISAGQEQFFYSCPDKQQSQQKTDDI